MVAAQQLVVGVGVAARGSQLVQHAPAGLKGIDGPAGGQVVKLRWKMFSKFAYQLSTFFLSPSVSNFAVPEAALLQLLPDAPRACCHVQHLAKGEGRSWLASSRYGRTKLAFESAEKMVEHVFDTQ